MTTWKHYRYYMKRELFEKAVNVMRQALATFPNDAELHYTTGTLYERLRMNSMALAEYKKARTLNQHHVGAGIRIKAITSESGKTGDQSVRCDSAYLASTSWILTDGPTLKY